ncbi:MAG TPA: serine hydrolase domain-containing protein [Caulobacteraceae bacterium]|jgi:CubicO group peptidase (beta-lactamase class C family)
MTIQQRMALYEAPGVSIALIDDDRIAWSRHYGVADKSSGRRVDDDTLFEASSIAKVVTALVTLRLVREGKLSLDADVNSELVSWKLPGTPFTATERVTVRRLLSHTGGVNVHGFGGYAPGTPLPTALQTLQGVPPANNVPITVDETPGSAFRYSGGGYEILAQLVEDVARQPYDQFARSRVLVPANMRHSLITATLPVDRGARGYEGGAPVPRLVYPELGAAGLMSTAADLARLAIEMDRELHARSDRILDQSLIKQMLSRQTGGWGLGVSLSPPGKERWWSKDGANTGYSSLLFMYPDRRQGAAIMTNGASQSGFVYEIAASLAREYGWTGFEQSVRAAVPLEAAWLRRFQGVWRAGIEFEIGIRGDHLFVRGGPFGPKPVDLYAQSPNSFFVLSTGFTFDFDPKSPDHATLAGSIAAVKVRSLPDLD